MRQLFNRVSLFARLLVGATRSNHAHWAEGGRGGKSWLASIPLGSLAALWEVSDDYGQMEAQIGGTERYFDGTETIEGWVQTHVEDVGLTVYMCTPFWRAQGEGEGVVQFNPWRWSQNGYFLCFMSKGKVLPLPWLWGVVIPHPSELLADQAEVKAEDNFRTAYEAEERRLFSAGLMPPRYSGRSSRGVLQKMQQINAAAIDHALGAEEGPTEVSDAACYAALDEAERYDEQELARRSNGRLY